MPFLKDIASEIPTENHINYIFLLHNLDPA